MSINDAGDVAVVLAIVAFFLGNIAQIIAAVSESRQRYKDRQENSHQKEQDRKEARRQERVKFLIDAFAELWEWHKKKQGKLDSFPFFAAKARCVNDHEIRKLVGDTNLVNVEDADRITRGVFDRIGELIEEAQRSDS
jgi:hypothetical protein